MFLLGCLSWSEGAEGRWLALKHSSLPLSPLEGLCLADSVEKLPVPFPNINDPPRSPPPLPVLPLGSQEETTEAIFTEFTVPTSRTISTESESTWPVVIRIILMHTRYILVIGQIMWITSFWHMGQNRLNWYIFSIVFIYFEKK